MAESKTRRSLPLFDELRSYDRSWLSADLVAAVTNHDEMNLIAALAAKQLGAKHVVARVHGIGIRDLRVRVGHGEQHRQCCAFRTDRPTGLCGLR